MQATCELKCMEFLLAEMSAITEECIKGESVVSRTEMDKIRDDSIIGNSEKMMFFTKELIASAEDPSLIQNPFVLTKLNVATVKETDFDFYQSRDFVKKKTVKKKKKKDVQEIAQASWYSVKGGEGDKPESKAENKEREAVKSESDESDDNNDIPDIDRMYEQAEAQKKRIEAQTALADPEAADLKKRQRFHEREKHKAVPKLRSRITRKNMPTMLQVCCNSIELMRLRNLLVNAYHQRAVLQEVYQS